MSSSSSSAAGRCPGRAPAQQLNRTNHLAWKALVLPAFRGARVMGLLDGTDRALSETLETEDENKKKVEVENPAYTAWIAWDQHVLRFLLNSLSLDILSHVLGVSSSAEAWSTIDSMFKTVARSKIQHLRSQLNDTKKLAMTVDDYFTKMKGFASELATVGKPLDEDELIGYLLRGLDKDHYNSLITNINGKPDPMLDDFFGQLSSYDMRNGPGHGAHEGFTSSANIARRGHEYDRDYCPRGRSPERGCPDRWCRRIDDKYTMRGSSRHAEERGVRRTVFRDDEHTSLPLFEFAGFGQILLLLAIQ